MDTRQTSYLEDSLFDGIGNSELENIDVARLPKAMSPIERLFLPQQSMPRAKIRRLKQTSRAGFHHMSTRITLLQQVKFRPGAHKFKDLPVIRGENIPVLPALNEIRMHRVLLLVRIFSSDASR